ncbi:hypothetical protein L210DRAFT_3640206 [Boletus edulis BED1]|uniref:Uncharacterized protein n=1 Tax=Boletus edulis BED1 TaxID=1328754 RepID=A0AAD4C7M9_BOLED|nr:hypothetical protein L210DRAFT_3640206 [Boletus edulis BED1]
MLVPPRLSNGQPSTRQLKNVSVYFEDKWTTNESANLSNGKPSGKGNRMTTKTTGLGPSQRRSSDSTAQLSAEGSERRRELIKELQQRWTCSVHTHGDNPVYCYAPSGESAMCYPLTLMRLGMWATEIMKDSSQVTVEDIPAALWEQIQKFAQPKIPTQARAGRSQMPAGLNPQLPNHPQAGSYGYYPPPAPAPVIIMQPPWGGPIQGGDGSWYPYQPTAQPANSSTQKRSSSLRTQSDRSTSPVYSTTTTSHSASDTQFSIDNIPDSKTPEIVGWFASLDQHEERKKDDINFASFGTLLYDEGFCHLSQLSPNLITCEELAKWMHTSKGTAMFVRRYAKQDLEALLSR